MQLEQMHSLLKQIEAAVLSFGKLNGVYIFFTVTLCLSFSLDLTQMHIRISGFGSGLKLMI